MTTYDAYTRVSNAQAVTGSTSIVSESSILLSAPSGPGGARVARDIGVGERVAFRVHVTTTLTVSQEMTVRVIIASDAALTTNVTPIGASVVINTDNLIAGEEFDVPIPQLAKVVLNGNGDTYIGLRYEFDGSLAAGAVSAWMPLGQSHGVPKRYAGNYTGP